MASNINKTKAKSIVFIPPEGVLIKQDFALYRIIDYFNSINIATYLLLSEKTDLEYNLTKTTIINVSSKDDIVKYLENNYFDLIFHRTWMHRYIFTAKLAKKFDNIVIYIKDAFLDFSREEYSLLYTTDEDLDGLQTLFSSNRLILSHYSRKTYKNWKKKYNIKNIDNFIFFPEYCNKNRLYTKKSITYNKNKIKILYAGGITPTTYPDSLAMSKPLYDTLFIISEQKIQIDIKVLPKVYMNINDNKQLFFNYLYQDKFNKYFNIKEGKAFNHKDSEAYHFGIIAGHNCPKENKYSNSEFYAVTSKFAYYMECGLPVIVSSNMKKLSNIVEKNQIGFSINDNELKDLKSILSISEENYKEIVNNIYKFRQTFIYNNKNMEFLTNLLEKDK